VTAAQNTNIDIFTPKTATNNFAAPIVGSNVDSDTSFGSNKLLESGKPGSLFGGTGFKLGSTFKPDGSAKDDGPTPINSSGVSFFGNGFGAALDQTQKAPIGDTPIVNEADMDADEPESSHRPKEEEPSATKQAVSPAQEAVISTTPMSTPAPKFQFPGTASSVKTGIFGTPPSSEIRPTIKESNKSTSFTFGTPLTSIQKNPEDSSLKPSPLFPALPSSESPQIKQEPQSDEETSNRISTVPEAPLPPDPTSKSSYTVGESSASSIEPDAPLPPDFISGARSKDGDRSELPLPDKKKEEATHSPEDVDGPAEGHDSDFGTEDEGDMSDVGSEEGSGEDVAEAVSPISEMHQTPGFTPQSSFGGATNRGTGEGFFKVPQPPKSLNSGELF
jgi:nucleoporin NUP159